MAKLIDAKELEAELFKILPTFPETPFDKGKREGIMQAVLALKRAKEVTGKEENGGKAND